MAVPGAYDLATLARLRPWDDVTPLVAWSSPAVAALGSFSIVPEAYGLALSSGEAVTMESDCARVLPLPEFLDKLRAALAPGGITFRPAGMGWLLVFHDECAPPLAPQFAVTDEQLARDPVEACGLAVRALLESRRA